MERKDQKVNDTWDLTSLCKDEKDWSQKYQEVENLLKDTAKFEGKIKKCTDTLYEALCFLRDTGIKLEVVYSWAFLNYESDASEATNQKNYALAGSLWAKFNQATSFVEPEIQAIDKAKLEDFLKSEKSEGFRVYISKILHNSEHILSEKEERILSLQAESAETAQKAFHDLADVDLVFDTVDGRPLTQSSYVSFLLNPDEKIRKEAYDKFYAQFAQHQNTIAQLYSGSVKQDIFMAKARGYKTALQRALDPDNVPEDVYRSLINSVHKGFPILHRYYALRKKLLKKDKLGHWDVYLPMTEGVKVVTPYDEAVKIIEKAVAPLGKEYQEVITKGLSVDRWVDRYENKGKRSGAFSAGCFTGKPYILMNYKDEVPHSIFTLAHEGGHSMHSYYSAKNNPFMQYDYTIFEAEVASTFNEQLVNKYLLDNAENDDMKAYLIASQLSDITGTLFRQTMFAEFELLVHEAVENGTPATIDMLRKTYRSLLEQYFGPDVEFTENSDMEGLRIPHFYRAFYVYKYSTGISAAIALSQRVLNGTEKEREEYLSFLKNGGSNFPIDSLKIAGVDMSKTDAVDSAIKYFESLLDQFEKLIEK